MFQSRQPRDVSIDIQANPLAVARHLLWQPKVQQSADRLLAVGADTGILPTALRLAADEAVAGSRAVDVVGARLTHSPVLQEVPFAASVWCSTGHTSGIVSLKKLAIATELESRCLTLVLNGVQGHRCPFTRGYGKPSIVHDSTAATCLDTEASLSRKTDVAIAACDCNFELISELALVDVVGRRDDAAPPDAFDVRHTGRFGAGGVVRVHGRIALEVDVEGSASFDGVALVGTALDVVGVEESETQVTVCVGGGTRVGEDGVETDGGQGGLSLLRVIWVCSECGRSVRSGAVVNARWLRIAGVGIAFRIAVAGSSRCRQRRCGDQRSICCCLVNNRRAADSGCSRSGECRCSHERGYENAG